MENPVNADVVAVRHVSLVDENAALKMFNIQTVTRLLFTANQKTIFYPLKHFQRASCSFLLGFSVKTSGISLVSLTASLHWLGNTEECVETGMKTLFLLNPRK